MVHQIREIGINDVQDFIKLLKSIYDESDFMIYNPGEYAPSINDALSKLEHFITSPTNAIYIAEYNSELVGFATVTTKDYERAKHEAKFSMGVVKFYREKGLGQSLINSVEAWCLNHNIRRIEVTVVTENVAAVDIFKATGYQIEGELRDKLFIDNKYYNEYVMSKLLL
ncbi:GNAT family N-acetyltransferase [Staphylococcus kloosii]|uniref:Acetyltransferase n=1 Tax=Staphylococcus kloosii TaxID=29384 RepID=A0ABQ0XNJ0_9STAP|nr:GNAT family N-acetyltransferase [Staphylococcus kloosii]AVQ36884.1 N-acetyltransferase [Staphylococcus kloosii]PNZ06994.1 GNAT family N-acetyltransferase [Staphylococcus kloosii]GEP82992.1 acetyltransferase [Staphylococcus kloosii]SUM49984.1 acetyltransferase [Staphylococcus kloosii]